MGKQQEIDWMRLEADISAVLLEYRRGAILGVEACRVVDALLAQATGRGEVLPLGPLPWEPTHGFDAAARVRVPQWFAKLDGL